MAAPIVQDSATASTSSTFLGINHTPSTTSQPDRAFFFCLGSRGNSSLDTSFTNVSYNGIPMVPVVNIDTGGFSLRSAIFWLPDSSLPAGPGSYFVNISTSNAQQVSGTILEVTGVLQVTSTNTATSTSTVQAFSYSTNIGTLVTDALLLDGISGDFTGTMSPSTAGQTEISDNSPGNLTHGVSRKTVVTPQATSMGWSFTSGSNRTAHSIVEVSSPTSSSGGGRPMNPGFFF